MAIPPLRLEQHYYDEVVVRARADASAALPADAAINVNARFAATDEDNRVWRVELRVEVAQRANVPPPGYEISVRAVGLFRVHPQFPEAKMQKLIAVTGVSILYSGMRDFLMTITARGPWGSVLLPTTSFTDLEPAPEVGTGRRQQILDILAVMGDAPLRTIAERLGVPVEAARPVVRLLIREGAVVQVGKGRGTKYRLAGGGR